MIRTPQAMRVESDAKEEISMATGIKDKVAIIGMGCTRFGERWESGPRS